MCWFCIVPSSQSQIYNETKFMYPLPTRSVIPWDEPMPLWMLSLSDGAALWTDELGQHLLHERHSAVSTLCARAQNCTQEVIFTAITVCRWRVQIITNNFTTTGFSCRSPHITLPLQVFRCSAIFRGKCTISVHHSRCEACQKIDILMSSIYWYK